jgi:RNA polymerase sigma-70 factor, ECF subfamily
VGDALEVDGAGPADHADDLVALVEQQLGQVGAVLAGDAGDDDALVAAAQADLTGPRGRAAASLLLARYHQRVYAWCYRHVRDPELALDLAQDVLLSAYRNLASFGGRGGFGAWLFAIVRNRCLSELRRTRIDLEDEQILALVADSRPTPERTLEQKEDEDVLLDLIARHLDPLEQEALWLRCVERMAIDDITELLAVRESTGARAVLQRARRKLRAALARAGEGQEGTVT